MTEFLARVSARRPLLIIAIWATVGLVAGVLAVDLLVSGLWQKIARDNAAALY